MPNFCAVMNCGSNGLRDKVSFFRFPSKYDNNKRVDLRKLKRREAWIAALKREDITDLKLKYQMICAKHFLLGKPARLEDEDDPDWVPTQNMGYERLIVIQNQFATRKCRNTKRTPNAKKQKLNDDNIPSVSTKEEVLNDVPHVNIHKVCERHFSKSDILFNTSAVDWKKGIILTSPLYKPKLKHNAVPSILPKCDDDNNPTDSGAYSPALEFVDVEAVPTETSEIRVPEIHENSALPIEQNTSKLPCAPPVLPTVQQKIFTSSTTQTGISPPEDEFYHFCKSLACQLRKMPLEQALVCQAKLQEAMTKEHLYQIGTCKYEENFDSNRYEVVVKEEDLAVTDFT